MPGRHTAFRQGDITISEVKTFERLRETPQFQYLECLLKMQVLAEVHHVNRTIDVILLEFDLGQSQIFGKVKRGAVAAQDDRRPVSFFCEPEFLVDLDDHRTLRAFV